MSVDQVVADAVSLREEVDITGELVYVEEELVFVIGSERAGGQVYYASVLTESLDLGGLRVLEAGEDIDTFAAPPKLSAQFSHVNVHTTRFAATEQRLGTG
jgi:hypothetical protein